MMIPGIVAQRKRTTPAPDLPTYIGEPFGGGYYIGDIGLSDGLYAIIMADSSVTASLLFRVTNLEAPGTDSLGDGLLNTNAIIAIDIDAFPAVKFCVDFLGGGFSDWYMPSINELGLAATNIAQLSALVLVNDWHWSSSNHSSDRVWIQNPVSGVKPSTGSVRNTPRLFRPVRRIKKS